ncbi:hypothetical protein VNO78_02916 [Psophocarpus tetragonolobus]|uniref:Uncharacterized protein n=1 Tax=Psophocarpus tetragonolobus TaxID=3891 RepID=A0AAN9XW46_PSOTE
MTDKMKRIIGVPAKRVGYPNRMKGEVQQISFGSQGLIVLGHLLPSEVCRVHPICALRVVFEVILVGTSRIIGFD